MIEADHREAARKGIRSALQIIFNAAINSTARTAASECTQTVADY